MATFKGKPKPTRAATKSAAPAPTTKKSVNEAERQRMIGEAAYYLAEKRGFTPGHHDADWAEAERQINAKLKAR